MITISETTARTVRELMDERIADSQNFDEFFHMGWTKRIIEYVLSDNYECLKEFLRGE